MLFSDDSYLDSLMSLETKTLLIGGEKQAIKDHHDILILASKLTFFITTF